MTARLGSQLPVTLPAASRDMAHTYIVRVGSDEPLLFASQAAARHAANDAIIESEIGSVVAAMERLCDLAAYGTVQLTDGRIVTISVESDDALAGREGTE